MQISNNLTLSEQQVKDFIMKKYNRKVVSTDEVILFATTDIAAQAKHIYYGYLRSKAGVTVKKDTVVFADVQGNEGVEVFFDALEAFGNNYSFIGFKYQINQ